MFFRYIFIIIFFAYKPDILPPPFPYSLHLLLFRSQFCNFEGVSWEKVENPSCSKRERKRERERERKREGERERERERDRVHLLEFGFVCVLFVSDLVELFTHLQTFRFFFFTCKVVRGFTVYRSDNGGSKILQMAEREDADDQHDHKLAESCPSI